MTRTDIHTPLPHRTPPHPSAGLLRAAGRGGAGPGGAGRGGSRSCRVGLHGCTGCGEIEAISTGVAPSPPFPFLPLPLPLFLRQLLKSHPVPLRFPIRPTPHQEPGEALDGPAGTSSRACPSPVPVRFPPLLGSARLGSARLNSAQGSTVQLWRHDRPLLYSWQPTLLGEYLSHTC